MPAVEIKRIGFTGLKIDRNRLLSVIDRAETTVSTGGLSKVYGQAARERRKDQILDEVLIALTREQYPSCRCESDHGLKTGITMRELQAIGGGCTDPQFVCPRLDRMRRKLGL